MLTPKEVAARLSVSKQTIYDWIAEGFIKAFDFKGKRKKAVFRIAPDEVERILRECQTVERPHVANADLKKALSVYQSANARRIVSKSVKRR